MSRAAGGRRAVVVADGDGPDRAALDASWPGWSDATELVIAADGGARTAERLGLSIDLIVGDGDSLGAEDLERFRGAGAAVRTAPVDKDETDTELALLAAIARGASEVTIVGALGGARVDHELANVALLAHPAIGATRVAILDPRGRISLVAAPAKDGAGVTKRLPGPVGAVVSLVPFGEQATGVTTAGLRYGLRDEALPFGPARGLSNVRTAVDASVTVRHGRLLVVEAPATLGR
jgi:thiamine pyrophosphokinase